MADTSTLIGLGLAVGSAACFDGAVILQASEARAVPSEHSLKPSLLKRLASRPRWLLGTAVAILGWPFLLGALSLAPITIVQPTLALGSILLLALGARFLGEHVGGREWTAACVVVAGVTVLAISAPPHTDYTPRGLEFTLVAAILAAITSLPFVLGRQRAGIRIHILAAGAAFSMGAISSKLVTIEIAHGRPLHAAGWAIGTIAITAAGFLIDMSALQRFKATSVAPPIFVIEVAIPVIAAPFLLGEHWSSTPGGGLLLGVGLALVLLGGAALAASATEMEKGIENAGSDPPPTKQPNSQS
jgi:drug/metabolite transporter (DMT)-like permease